MQNLEMVSGVVLSIRKIVHLDVDILDAVPDTR